MNNVTKTISAVAVVIVLGLVFLGRNLYVAVPPGHVAVSSLFGDVREEFYREGLHVPVNPLLEWHFYDAREKTIKETIKIPSQDQLQTVLDISIQYRIKKEMAPYILKNTGDINDVLEVHIIPAIRSVIREQGKNIENAENFFNDSTQVKFKTGIQTDLEEYLGKRGIVVSDVFLRDINLPDFIVKAIEKKKEREQEVKKQKAELERFKAEQQKKVAQANAEKTAAEKDAEKISILAKAEADKISRLNEAIKDNPAYIQLQAME
ncbi:MAG: SPFH domain-containing protein, partial [Fibrobacterota bacterium]